MKKIVVLMAILSTLVACSGGNTSNDVKVDTSIVDSDSPHAPLDTPIVTVDTIPHQ